MTKIQLTELISSTADESLKNCKNENPLIAWTTFFDRLDSKVRRKIGDTLEANGKSRYTGEPVSHS